MSFLAIRTPSANPLNEGLLAITLTPAKDKAPVILTSWGLRRMPLLGNT
jgi:hypothetical protein